MQNETKKPAGLPGLSVSFSGNVSEMYEQLLGDFLFEPYASDLVHRIGKSNATNILELACGTGRVTKKLLQQLPASIFLTATDLEADMLNVARSNIVYPNVSWNVVDMTDIPYESNLFDMILCQFGLMLVPDKLKALSEIHRVLRPGGKLIFSVWGNLDENDIWRIGGEVLNAFLGINPIIQDPGPFSMNVNDTLFWLNVTGFIDAKATIVKQTGMIATAAMAAEGFINGLPVHVAIKNKNPALLPKIEKALELELIKQLGNHPLRSRLNAWLFETIK